MSRQPTRVYYNVVSIKKNNPSLRENHVLNKRGEPVDKRERFRAVTVGIDAGECVRCFFVEPQIRPGDKPPQLYKDPWGLITKDTGDVRYGDEYHWQALDPDFKSTKQLHLVLWNELRKGYQYARL